jgi:hypothetical protein
MTATATPVKDVASGAMTRGLAALALTLALAGCAGTQDPFQRQGTWQPTHINDANIAAMVADKRQLTEGVGDDASPAQLSAQAVTRLFKDRVKPLPSTEIGPVSAAPQTEQGGGS